MNNNVIQALEEIKSQIEIDCWSIPVNDRGSGSAGVRLIKDTDAVDLYILAAKDEDVSDLAPQIKSIDYVTSDDFDEELKEVAKEMADQYYFVELNEIVGLVICNEHYDMDYTFYIAHIKE